jgi:hypothetical protein
LFYAGRLGMVKQTYFGEIYYSKEDWEKSKEGWNIKMCCDEPDRFPCICHSDQDGDRDVTVFKFSFVEDVIELAKDMGLKIK